MKKTSSELKNTTYELFIGALSVLSIFNLFLVYLIPDSNLEGVIFIMDGFLSLVFMADFTYRLFTTHSKSRYFFRQFGWADLLASLPLPQLKILRLFRIFRAGRLMREFGLKNMLREFLGNRGSSALFVLIFFIFLVLEFGGLTILTVESRARDGNIKTASDALWYVYVTITTVGYGDYYPVTNIGRFIGLIIMTMGVGLFGTLTGFLANAFLQPASKPETEAAPLSADSAAPRVKLAELKKLLEEQQKIQTSLQDKLAEIEKIFPEVSTGSKVS